jgi:hypothetical protein
MLNVKYMPITQQAQLPEFKTVFSDKNGVVLELEQTLPKAWFVFDANKATSGKEALDYVSSPSFDPWSSAIVEGLEVEADFEVEDESIATVTTYEPRKITIKTSNPEDGFLVLSEMYYPKGWKAFLDGNEIPIYKTNFVLRGMFVPKGEHEIELTFNPTSHETGVLVSWFGTGLIWLLLAMGIFKNQKQTDN